MPRVDVVVESPIAESFRVQQVRGMFDLPPAVTSREEFHVELPGHNDDWQIGVIVGPSGSGKSTIARSAYGDTAYGDAVSEAPAWPDDLAVIDALSSESIKRITHALSAVGFSSPPIWLKPFHALSTGEQFRCELAAALLSDRPLVVFDEFTSVVDRTVARVGSAAVARAIRKRGLGRKFVAVTCHTDVLPWLEPDWVLDMSQGRSAKAECCRGRLRRPEINLEVRRCPRELWPRFANHHYLSGQLNPAAVCYTAELNANKEEQGALCATGSAGASGQLPDEACAPNCTPITTSAMRSAPHSLVPNTNVPVAFCAMLNAIGHRGVRRISRLVVLPDYQGIGVGGRLMDAVGEINAETSHRTTITTSHPAMIAHLRKASRWRVTSVRRGGSGWGKFAGTKNIRGTSRGRTVVSAEFVREETPGLSRDKRAA